MNRVTDLRQDMSRSRTVTETLMTAGDQYGVAWNAGLSGGCRLGWSGEAENSLAPGVGGHSHQGQSSGGGKSHTLVASLVYSGLMLFACQAENLPACLDSTKSEGFGIIISACKTWFYPLLIM